MVLRAPASIGAADLVALRSGDKPRFIQVKATLGHPWDHFGPRERHELCTVAAQAGGVAELLHWPPRGQPKWYAEAAFPGRANGG